MKKIAIGTKVQYHPSVGEYGNTGIIVSDTSYIRIGIDYSGYTFVLWDYVNNVSPIETRHLIIKQ